MYKERRGFSDDPIKAEIKARISISDIAGYSSNRAPCPIKDCPSGGNGRDTHLSDDFWYCHVCKRGGDVFEWVTNSDGVTYATARRSLAERLGIALSPNKARTEILRKVMVAAHRYLFDTKPEKLKYLLETRGLSRSTCFRHQLGYIDANGAVLEESGVTHEDLLKVGLYYPARVPGEGDLSVMAARYIFPIRDVEGRIIQLKGRADPAFWSADTKKSIPLQKQPPKAPREWGSYSHLNHLYLEETLKDVRKNYVIIAEGEPDTLTLQGLGLPAVGLQTSQGMHKHSHKLRKFKQVFVMLDNDVASQRMIVNELYELQIKLPESTVWNVLLPKQEGDKKMDVNDFVKETGCGEGEILRMMKGATAAREYIVDQWGPEYGDREIFSKLSKLILSVKGNERKNLLTRLAGTTGRKVEFLAFAIDPAGYQD